MRSTFALLVLVLGCPVEPPPPTPFCGDGALDAGEACDDGNNADADGCNADCSLAACENGIKDPGEVCLVGPVDLAASAGASGMVSGDFNGDGALDLAVANTGESLSLFLGDGAGTFSRSAEVPLQGAALPLVSGDFNSDGALDLATSLITGPDSIPVVRGDGAGGFLPFATLQAGISSDSLTVGDFNGDGALDLVADDGPGSGIALFLNSGEGGFVVPRSLSSGGAFSVVAGDLNGDGALDVVAGFSAGLLVLLGDGAGGFSSQLLEVGTASDLVTADFNGDGALDVVGVLGGAVRPFFGDGAGGFSAAVALPLFGALGVVVGDFNGDGALDVVASSGIEPVSKSAHVTLFLGDGAGGFEALPALPLGFSGPQGIAAGDFNGDGVLDVAVSDASSGRLQLFFSQP